MGVDHMTERGEYFLYIRVSTTGQNIISQEKLAEKYNVYNDNIYIDKLSGKDMNRPSLQELLARVREHDKIVIASLDRISRDRKETKEVVETLQEKGVTLIIDNMPALNSLLKGNGGNKLINEFLYSIIIEVLSLQNQQSREYIKEKQRLGIKANKDNFIGKQRMYSADSKDSGRRALYFQMVRDIENGVSINQTAKNAGVSRNVVRKIIKDDGIKSKQN